MTIHCQQSLLTLSKVSNKSIIKIISRQRKTVVFHDNNPLRVIEVKLPFIFQKIVFLYFVRKSSKRHSEVKFFKTFSFSISKGLKGLFYFIKPSKILLTFHFPNHFLSRGIVMEVTSKHYEEDTFKNFEKEPSIFWKIIFLYFY